MQFVKPMKKNASRKLGDYLLAGALVLLLTVILAGFFYWIFYDDTAADTVRSVAKDTPGMNVPK